MSLMTILNLRSEFEEIIRDFNMGCQVPKGDSGSDINTLEWFVEHGYRSNSLRSGYDRAMDIANSIIAESNEWQKEQKQLLTD